MSYRADKFRVDAESMKIICNSKHGSDYIIWFDEDGIRCDCKGFEIRGTCRHLKEARDEGYVHSLLVLIQEAEAKVEKGVDNFCRNCGKIFGDDDNFCGYCGTKRK